MDFFSRNVARLSEGKQTNDCNKQVDETARPSA